MRTIIILTSVVVTILFTRDAAANACLIQPEEQVTSVYFSNGILTEELNADGSAIALHTAYKEKLEARDSESTFAFFKAYNYTQGALTDITQVLQQKQNELGIQDEGLSAYQVYQWIQAGLTVEEIRETIALMGGIVSRGTLSAAFTEEALGELADTLFEASTDALADRQTVNSNHVELYEADLLSGKRVFVVAHSQGNLFTNQAIVDVGTRNPDLAPSLGAIGVATPANFTVGNNTYITAHDDRVIDGLRLISNVLPSNIENDPGVFGDFRSFTNHFFDRDYFDPRLASRAAIDLDIENLADTLPYPEIIAGEGAIRASLTWGSEPDVDLHAFEPDGTHVYYLQLRGTSGFLDVDDTTSFGPENYFVSCDDVVLGTYTIGVNYFRGAGTETANVALFLGDGRNITPRSQLLSASRGSSGDSSPVTIFQIDVTQNEDGIFEYVVR